MWHQSVVLFIRLFEGLAILDDHLGNKISNQRSTCYTLLFAAIFFTTWLKVFSFRKQKSSCIFSTALGISSVFHFVVSLFLLPDPGRVGKQFEVTLLLQSIVMIVAMFAMLHLCCTVQSTNRMSTNQHRLSGEGSHKRIRRGSVQLSLVSSSCSPKEGAIWEVLITKRLLCLLTGGASLDKFFHVFFLVLFKIVSFLHLWTCWWNNSSVSWGLWSGKRGLKIRKEHSSGARSSLRCSIVWN